MQKIAVKIHWMRSARYPKLTRYPFDRLANFTWSVRRIRRDGPTLLFGPNRRVALNGPDTLQVVIGLGALANAHQRPLGVVVIFVRNISVSE